MIYNMKLLYSPVKWMCALVFSILIPVIVYAPTYYDFTNVCNLYMPFVAVLLFSEISLVDKDNNFLEIRYIIDRKPIKTFIQRYIVITFVFLILLIISNAVFRIIQFTNDLYYEEAIFLYDHIFIVSGASIFLGSLSMVLSNFFGNIYVGYGSSFIYWIYWNVNNESISKLNLFPFLATPTNYENTLCLQWILILVIMFFGAHLNLKFQSYF